MPAMALTHGGPHLQELARICSSLQAQLVIAEVWFPAIVGSKSVAVFVRVELHRMKHMIDYWNGWPPAFAGSQQCSVRPAG